MINANQLQAMINSITGFVEEEYAKILTSLESYHNLHGSVTLADRYAVLKNLYTDITVYLKQYPHSSKNQILTHVKEDCQKELYTMIRNTKKPVKKDVIISELSFENLDVKESYLNFWKALNPDYTFKFYYDSEAFAANIMLNFLQEEIGIGIVHEIEEEFNEVGEEHSEIFIEKRMNKVYAIKRELKRFFIEKRSIDSNIIPSEIIKEFLVTKYHQDASQFEAKRTEYINSYENMGAIDIRANMTSIFDAFDPFMYQVYEKELFLELNSFDANHILSYILLDKFGGVNLDINYLPEIKEHVFLNIPIPQSTPEEMMRIKMVAIMREKNYVTGYEPDIDQYYADLYNALSDPVKQSIKDELAMVYHPSELFKSIGQLSVSELSFTAHFEDPSVHIKSPLIAAHENSLGTQAIMHQIKIKYSMLDDIFGKIIFENDTYNAARRAVYKLIQQTADRTLRIFLINIRYYIDYNFGYATFEYFPSTDLTGNNMLKSAVWNIVNFDNSIVNVLNTSKNKRMLMQFQLPESKITYPSQLAEWRRDDFNVKKQRDFKNVAEREGISIRSIDDFSEGNPIDIDGLTKICNAAERFLYEKSYLHIFLQVQEDTTVNINLIAKFAKHAENSLLVQMTIDQENMYYFDPATKQAVKARILDGLPRHLHSYKKMKLTIVGHGSGIAGRRLANMTPNQLLKYISPTMFMFRQIMPTMQYVNVDLFACKMLSLSLPSLQDTFPAQFLFQINHTDSPIKSLVNGDIENISVAASPYSLAVFDGRLAVFLDGEIMMNTRDELRLRGIIPKHSVKYVNGVLTVQPKEVKDSFEARYELEKAFRSSMASNMATPADQISDTFLDDLGVLMDYEDIASSSVLEGQPRRNYTLSDIQKKSLELSDFLQTVDRVDRNIYEIKQEHGLSEDYIAILDSVAEREGKYFIKFASQTTGEIKEIMTETEGLMEYKELSESKLRPVVEHIANLSRDNFTYDYVNIEHTTHISTLNAAFFVQVLLDYIAHKGDINQLSTAVQVQIYSQMTSTSLGLFTDASHVLQTIYQAQRATLQLLPKLVQAIQFLSFVLDGISLGASIYALIHAKDDFERKILQSSVGLTSINFALGLSTTSAYFVGASTAAEVLGVLAVPIIGLTIGLGSLVNNLLKIEHDAEQVVEFFKILGKVKTEGYYMLSSDQKTLSPNPLVPVEGIDFRYKNIKFGSINISGTKGGSIVSGGSYPHYFAAPEPDNKGGGISISDVLFHEIQTQDILQNDTVILPCGLNVRYYTNYNWVAGSGSWSGDGVNVLNQLHNRYGRSFDWRYYAAGGERSITHLDPEYAPTEVRVLCDVKDRTFISSIIEDRNASEKLKYTIYYNDSKYTYVFQHTPIALSLLPLDWDTEYHTDLNLKIDNIVYETKLESGEIVQDIRLKKLGDIIKVKQNETQYKNVALHGVKEYIKDTDTLKVLEIKIGEQTVNFYGKTNENLYLSFHSKEFEIALKVDPDKERLEKVIVFGNMEDFKTNKLNQLSYLKNYNLPDYMLENVQIVLNEGLKNNKNGPVIRGSVDIMKNEYVLVIDKEVDSQHTYTHIIKDSNLSADEIILELNSEQAMIFKKPRKVEESENIATGNNYFLQGYATPKIRNGRVFGDSQYPFNQYLMDIIGDNDFVLKKAFFVRTFMTEVLSILNGIPTVFDVFGFNEPVDPNTKNGRHKINTAIDSLIKNYCVGDSISLKNAEPLNISFDSDTVLSGVDFWDRNLDFIYHKGTYTLISAYWSSKERDLDFLYNALGQKELTVTKQKYARDKHTIEISNQDITYLHQYITNILIMCNLNTNMVRFSDLNETVTGVDNLTEINIALPIQSYSNSLVIKLPFLRKDLIWDAEGTNFIIRFAVNGVNKKLTILDAFHLNHLDKTIYIALKDNMELDLASFMKL